MPGLFFDSGIDKGFEKDLKRMDKSYNSFSGGVEKQNKSMESSFNKLALTIGATFSAAQIVRFGKDSVNLYRDQQKALAQVEQGLKSTGNAAGLTFEELQKGASDLQKTTLFGDEDILQNATAQLLTFTNIADDQFTRTQKVALDLATRLDGDLKSSAIQLGKALNDPVANLSALSRSGIQFSEEQKKLIKTLAETGRLAEAQTVILDELETQYGGSAEAAAKADGGFTQLSNSIGDVQETLGGVITEGLQPFIKELQEFLNSLTEEEIRNFIENVKDGAQVIGVLITAIAAWKAGLLIMNQIQKINTALTALNTQARIASARAGKEVTRGNILMAGSFKKLKLAFASNPVGLLVTGLTLAIPLIRQFTSGQKEVLNLTAVSDGITAKYNKKLGEELANFESLFYQLKKTNSGSVERNNLLKKVNSTYGTTLKNIKDETSFLAQLDKAYISITNSIKRKIALEAQSETLTELIKKESFGKFRLIALEKELADLEKSRYTSGYDEKRYKALQKEIEGTNKIVVDTQTQQKKLIESTTETLEELDDGFKKYGSGAGDSDKAIKESLKNLKKLLSDQKKEYQNYNAAIEGLSGERLETVEKEYKGLIDQGNTYLDFLNNLLGEETDAKKQTIIKREIDVTTLQNNILEQKANQELFDAQKRDLQELEKAYRTYTQKRVALEKEYTENISKLREAGYEDQALQAEKALQRELKALDESILASDEKFQAWLKESLPNIAQDGILAIKKEIDKVDLSLKAEGLDPEQVIAFQAQIKILQKELAKKLQTEKQSPITWKDSLEIMNGVNQLVNDISNSTLGLDASFKKVLVGVTQTVSGVINMVTAFKALKVAASTLEKASAILAIISTAFQVISVISETFKKDAEAKKKAYIEELQAVQKVNVELIKQNALYKEGNELFSADKWGTALSGLEAYNQALDLQRTQLEDIDTIQESLEEFSAFSFASGLGDISDALTKIVDEYGNVDKAALQALLTSEKIEGGLRTQLENLLQTTELVEQTYAQFGSYISGIFGGIGDEMTQAFQLMYESGEDAMTSLEGTFSDMIESFTRDALEFAFLQPYLNELNNATKALGEQYAKGEITAEELQTNIIQTLGTFYDQMAVLQPEILSAFENADQIAEAAGFASAFDPPQETEPQDPLIDLIEGVAALGPEEVEIPEIEIPEIEIPEVIIEEKAIAEPAVPAIVESIQDIKEPVSTPGRISESITEQTGTVLAGRIGAMVLSNEKMLLNGYDMLEYAMQNLVYMRQIKLNTDYLPQIEENTRRMYEKLDSV